jgi:hypothetical protein
MRSGALNAKGERRQREGDMGETHKGGEDQQKGTAVANDKSTAWAKIGRDEEDDDERHVRSTGSSRMANTISWIATPTSPGK